MKVKGFLKDVTGASRVTKARLAAFENASPLPVKVDPIAEVAKAWHPGKLELEVVSITDASPTSKTVRFKRTDGEKINFFQAGQFMTVEFALGESYVTRPYSISSCPQDARGDDSFVEITVKSADGKGLIADYICDTLKVGDKCLGTVGCGEFYYEPLRDAKHVVALAGGIGITPFASMAKEIEAGKMDFDLTVLYGANTEDDIPMKAELDALKTDKVHMVYVIGEFITADIIKKYSADDTTYMLCGPQAMYAPMHKALDELGVADRRRRFEVFGQVKDITKYGYPADKADKTFNLTVRRGISEVTVPAIGGESIVVALERAGIKIDTGCRSGECGLCRTKVLSGEVFVSPVSDGRRAADKDFSYYHACATYPLSDVTIKIPIE